MNPLLYSPDISNRYELEPYTLNKIVFQLGIRVFVVKEDKGDLSILEKVLRQVTCILKSYISDLIFNWQTCVISQLTSWPCFPNFVAKIIQNRFLLSKTYIETSLFTHSVINIFNICTMQLFTNHFSQCTAQCPSFLKKSF